MRHRISDLAARAVVVVVEVAWSAPRPARPRVVEPIATVDVDLGVS